MREACRLVSGLATLGSGNWVDAVDVMASVALARTAVFRASLDVRVIAISLRLKGFREWQVV